MDKMILDIIAVDHRCAQAVKDRLSLYGIEIPNNAVYSHPSEGCYQWTVERSVSSVGEVSGTLTCYTTTDGEIYTINNQFISQSVYKNEPVISEKEAYQRLVDGYFQIEHNYKIYDLIINEVTLTYSPDTKGFYQPVYLFKCEINGENRDLVIAALEYCNSNLVIIWLKYSNAGLLEDNSSSSTQYDLKRKGQFSLSLIRFLRMDLKICFRSSVFP